MTGKTVESKSEKWKGELHLLCVWTFAPAFTCNMLSSFQADYYAEDLYTIVSEASKHVEKQMTTYYKRLISPSTVHSPASKSTPTNGTVDVVMSSGRTVASSQ